MFAMRFGLFMLEYLLELYFITYPAGMTDNKCELINQSILPASPRKLE
jgi:hypothetical protein